MKEIYLLHPATFKLDGGAMFGIIPKPLWEKKIQPDEFNRIKMALRMMLIKTENKNILIDTGIGDYHDDKFNHQFDIQSSASPISSILKQEFDMDKAGITDIILSHLHFDHVGGLTEKSSEHSLTFPNATIHLHEDHYKYALNPTLRDKGSFQDHFFEKALSQYKEKNQIHFISGDDGVILKDKDCEIKFKTSFGHTPYMIHPIIDQYIYMADLVPMSHHINIPWVMGYDIEPGTTTLYKEKFYKSIIDENLTMIFEHDIDYWGAKITQAENGKYMAAEKFMASPMMVQKIN